jgi:hypothetical protein
MATKRKIATGTPVYIRSDSGKLCWAPALQLETYNGRATVSIAEQGVVAIGCADHKKITIDLKDYPGNALPIQNVDSNGDLEDYKDMVDLPFMHEVSGTTAQDR